VLSRHFATLRFAAGQDLLEGIAVVGVGYTARHADDDNVFVRLAAESRGRSSVVLLRYVQEKRVKLALNQRRDATLYVEAQDSSPYRLQPGCVYHFHGLIPPQLVYQNGSQGDLMQLSNVEIFPALFSREGQDFLKALLMWRVVLSLTNSTRCAIPGSWDGEWKRPSNVMLDMCIPWPSNASWTSDTLPWARVTVARLSSMRTKTYTSWCLDVPAVTPPCS
jgi:hypothetical protein